MAEFIQSDINYPPVGFPTVFSDGVMNLAPSREVVKFYLSRFDPHVLGAHEYKNQPVVQIVMPITAFVQTVAFLSKALDSLREAGVVTAEQIAQMTKASGDAADASRG